MFQRERSFIYLAVIGAVISASLFIPFEVTTNHSFWKRVFDAGHVPLFFLLSCAIYFSLVKLKVSENKALLVSFLLTSIFAALSELIQPYFSRSAELDDWVYGSLGGATAILLIRATLSFHPRDWIIFVFTSLAVASFAGYPAFCAWRAIEWRNQAFPLLSSFEEKLEIYLWSANLEQGKSATALFERSSQFASHGEHSLYINTLPARFSGVAFDLGLVDASQRKTLEFEIYNEGEPFFLSIRIDDDGDVTEYEDRFNKRIPIRSGVTNVMIPVSEIQRGSGGRKLNLTQLKRIFIFVGEEAQQKQFYLDNLRFE